MKMRVSYCIWSAKQPLPSPRGFLSEFWRAAVKWMNGARKESDSWTSGEGRGTLIHILSLPLLWVGIRFQVARKRLNEPIRL